MIGQAFRDIGVAEGFRAGASVVETSAKEATTSVLIAFNNDEVAILLDVGHCTPLKWSHVGGTSTSMGALCREVMAEVKLLKASSISVLAGLN